MRVVFVLVVVVVVVVAVVELPCTCLSYKSLPQFDDHLIVLLPCPCTFPPHHFLSLL